MNLKTTIIALAALALTAINGQAQGSWGYANEATVSYRTGKRFNSGTEQGIAIKIPKEKAAMLKGLQVKGLRACFSTGSNISNCKAFISSSLDGTKDFEESISTVKLRFKEYEFTKNYTIGGESDLYVGFTLEYSNTLTNLFSVDNTAELPSGLAWVLSDNGWESIECGGAPAIYLMLDKAPEFTDVMTKPVAFEAFYTAGNSYDFSGQLLNCGSTTITSLDLGVKVGDGAEQLMTLTDLNIAPQTVYDYTITDCAIEADGNLPIEIKVGNVNGLQDADQSDNASICGKYIYPANVVKRTLLETFTGLSCYNCPSGSNNIKQAIEGIEDKISLVAHHTYGPDVFCMKEDYEMTWFFAGQTYAPAAMANRRPYSSTLTSPVVEATSFPHLTTILMIADQYAPYVHIDLSSDYNAATREVTVKADVTTYENPSHEINRLNIYLTQDNFSGTEFPQEGASADYTHNHVFRASLTGYWGEDIELIPGETVSKTYTYIIPESSVSTFSPKEYAIKWIPEDMHVIAFVGGVTDSPADCPVYNVSETTLINPQGGINDVLADHEFVSQEIFNLQGIRIAENNLTPGIYVVRKVASDGYVQTDKIVIK